MPHDLTQTDLADRIDRPEATEAVKQLAVRYALAVGMRDMGALVNLCLPNAKVSAEERGQQAPPRHRGFVLDRRGRPAGRRQQGRWSGSSPRPGTWHAHFPSRQEFRDNPDGDNAPVSPPALPEESLDTMRRGDRSVRPPDFGWTRGR